MVHSSNRIGREPLKLEMRGSNPAWITNAPILFIVKPFILFIVKVLNEMNGLRQIYSVFYWDIAKRLRHRALNSVPLVQIQLSQP